MASQTLAGNIATSRLRTTFFMAWVEEVIIEFWSSQKGFCFYQPILASQWHPLALKNLELKKLHSFTFFWEGCLIFLGRNCLPTVLYELMVLHLDFLQFCPFFEGRFLQSRSIVVDNPCNHSFWCVNRFFKATVMQCFSPS